MFEALTAFRTALGRASTLDPVLRELVRIKDALWADTRAQFSEAEVIELVAHTTLYIGFGRFNEIVGLDPA